MMITIYEQETLFDTALITIGIFVKDAYHRATDCVADQFNCITDEFNLIFDDNTLVPNEEWYQKNGNFDSFYDTSTIGDETAGYSTYASTFAGYETRNEHEEMQTTRQGERLKDESIQERDDDDDEKYDVLLTKVGSKDVIDLSKDTIINDLSKKAEGRIDQPIDVTKIEEKMRQDRLSRVRKTRQKPVIASERYRKEEAENVQTYSKEQIEEELTILSNTLRLIQEAKEKNIIFDDDMKAKEKELEENISSIRLGLQNLETVYF